MGDVLILFRNNKKLKLFDKQLLENKIIFKKENNTPFVNYNFKMVQIVQIATAYNYPSQIVLICYF